MSENALNMFQTEEMEKANWKTDFFILTSHSQEELTTNMLPVNNKKRSTE